MSKFQVITLIIFIFAIVGGVIAFATYKNSSVDDSLPAITVWGTFPADTFNKHVAEVNNSISSTVSVNYTQKSPEKFSQEFVSALARGIGPDVILLPVDRLLPEENKLTPIPFTALSQRDFMDSYIQEAQIYLTQNGAIGIPFTVDPLVMYWNRDTYNAAGLTTYARYWDEFSALNKQMTSKDQNGNVRKSAVALGTFNNITNAREILGTLLLQSGNAITQRQPNGGAESVLQNWNVSNPSSALTFYAKFANPADADYSWNKGMQNDKISFLSGSLATYFGLASELADIRNKNPNLNFDVAPLPQVRTGGKASAYGRMYGFSIVRASQKQNAAYQIISILTSAPHLTVLSQKMYLPTVLNVLNRTSTDPYIDNFNKAALIARTWLDADPVQSRWIFGNMIDSITSGKKSVSEAMQDAGNQYDVVLQQAVQ